MPGGGGRGEFTVSRWKPAVDGAAGEGGDLLGASCSLDPGSEALGECGKRLSDSLWASEDLSCGSEVRREELASRGSPEWSGAVDSQRAISLDAAECLTDVNNLSLVRSTALEDLTSIGDEVNQGEEPITEQDDLTPDGTAVNNITEETQEDESSCPSEDPPQTPHHVSMMDPIVSEEPCERGDSSLQRDGCSQPAGSETRSSDRRPPPQSPPARKSLVPVAVPKGLFAVTFTSSEPPQLSASTSLVSKQLLPSVMQHSPPEDLLQVLPPHVTSLVPPSFLLMLLLMEPRTATFSFGFRPVSVHAASPPHRLPLFAM